MWSEKYRLVQENRYPKRMSPGKKKKDELIDLLIGLALRKQMLLEVWKDAGVGSEKLKEQQQ